MDKEINSVSLTDLIHLRDKTSKERWEHLRKFEELQKKISKIEKEIYQKCDHKWYLDYGASGPYDGPDRICSVCNLYKS